jgi:hypothetical protein
MSSACVDTFIIYTHSSCGHTFINTYSNFYLHPPTHINHNLFLIGKKIFKLKTSDESFFLSHIDDAIEVEGEIHNRVLENFQISK